MLFGLNEIIIPDKKGCGRRPETIGENCQRFRSTCVNVLESRALRLRLRQQTVIQADFGARQVRAHCPRVRWGGESRNRAARASNRSLNCRRARSKQTNNAWNIRQRPSVRRLPAAMLLRMNRRWSSDVGYRQQLTAPRAGPAPLRTLPEPSRCVWQHRGRRRIVLARARERGPRRCDLAFGAPRGLPNTEVSGGSRDPA